MSTGEIILYQTEDGLTKINLRAIDGTVWLTQLEIAQLNESLGLRAVKFVKLEDAINKLLSPGDIFFLVQECLAESSSPSQATVK